MAEESPRFEAACGGKVPHASQAAAEAAFRFDRATGVVRSGEVMESYPCEFCGEWHLGHPPLAKLKTKGRSRRQKSPPENRKGPKVLKRARGRRTI